MLRRAHDKLLLEEILKSKKCQYHGKSSRKHQKMRSYKNSKNLFHVHTLIDSDTKVAPLPFFNQTSDIPYPLPKNASMNYQILKNQNIPKHKTAPYAKVSELVNGLNNPPISTIKSPLVQKCLTNKNMNLTSSQRSRKLTDNDSIIQDYIRDSGLISQIKAQEKKVGSPPNGFQMYQKPYASPSPRAHSLGNQFNYHTKFKTNLNPLSQMNQNISLTPSRAKTFLPPKFPVYQAPYKTSNSPDIPYSNNKAMTINSNKRTDIINFHVSNDLKPFIKNANYQRDSALKQKANKKWNKENLQFSDRTYKSRIESGKKMIKPAPNFDKEVDELNRSLTKLKNDLLVKKESIINQFMASNQTKNK
jgi:hypothetical protein